MDTAELKKRKDAAIFNLQKRDYEKAAARLAQYELANGLRDENENYIIEPLPVAIRSGERNPLIVQDEAERAAAQEVINNTPQAVIESVSS